MRLSVSALNKIEQWTALIGQCSEPFPLNHLSFIRTFLSYIFSQKPCEVLLIHWSYCILLFITSLKGSNVCRYRPIFRTQFYVPVLNLTVAHPVMIFFLYTNRASMNRGIFWGYISTEVSHCYWIVTSKSKKKKQKGCCRSVWLCSTLAFFCFDHFLLLHSAPFIARARFAVRKLYLSPSV